MTAQIKKTVNKTKSAYKKSKAAVKSASGSTKRYIMEYPKAISKKTPKWPRRLRNASIVLLAIGVGIQTAPVSLPAAIITAGGYATWGSGIIAAICQGFKESK